MNRILVRLNVLAASLAAFSVLHGQPVFTDVSAVAGIAMDFQGFPYGGGIAIGDFNGDGFEDIYVSNGEGLPNRLYLNNGDESFSETGAEAGVADRGAGMGVACGDIDNDGDLDLYLANHFQSNRLYLNDGSGLFEEAGDAGTADSGPATSVALLDYDRDGWLDIYVLNHAQDHLDYANVLYRNLGNGRFEDVTAESGAGGMSTSLAVGAFDFNGDLYPDIFVVNEYERDEVLLNLGDGSFANLRDEVIIPYGGGMGVDFADYDRDGDVDVYVTNLYRDFLLRNDGGETLTDVTESAGIENLTMGWGVGFMDYDNDGDRDIHVVNGAMIWPESYDETNVFFRHNGNNFYVEVAASVGLNSGGDSRASACLDFNNDGFMDVAILNIDRGNLQLFRNSPNANHWVRIRLTGTRSNRSGIGSRIEVRTSEGSQVSEIRSGGSYASNHTLIASFGLKQSTLIEEICVEWPSGTVQSIEDVDVDQFLEITEPGTAAPAIPQYLQLFPNYPNPFNPGTVIPLHLAAPGLIELRIMDSLGRTVRTIQGDHESGEIVVSWDGSDEAGAPVAGGVYLYRATLTTYDGISVSDAGKMTLVR